ncbi:MAG TPA: hypothetical protein VHW65_07150 [Gemmatimonadales bacterium]|jgi:hypothetical protein|nr:hypothetical protein [Gemmatimonadales bacterium]
MGPLVMLGMPTGVAAPLDSELFLRGPVDRATRTDPAEVIHPGPAPRSGRGAIWAMLAGPLPVPAEG